MREVFENQRGTYFKPKYAGSLQDPVLIPVWHICQLNRLLSVVVAVQSSGHGNIYH